ncbi:MAG: ATP-binding protein [Halolamina sp.]
MTDHEGQPIRVLHAEDDSSVRELVGDLFAAVSGVDVVSVPTPGDALERLHTERFDCVVSDYDGDESAAFLPLIEATAGGPPCLLLTGKERDQIDAAASAAVDDFVHKGAGEGFGSLTERVRQHAERYRSTERYRALFEEGAGPMVVHDADTGQVIDANPQFATLLGYDPERASELDISHIVPGEAPYTTERAMSRLSAAAAGEPQTFEWEHCTADGGRVPVEVTLTRMDVAGAGRVLATVRDVTAQRRNERRLEAQNERLDEFASMVSHDLRNPLNVVNGRLELVRSTADDERVCEHAAAAERATERMHDLIEELLAVARTDERNLAITAVPIRRAVNRAWAALSAGEATLTLAVDDVPIRADEGQLIRLFENLFRNAVEHAGPAVSVRVEGVPGGFAVVDDGPGIASAERDRVFESGYSTAADGTGYGLDIVQRIVDAHGWSVSLAEGDGGARFELTGVTFVEDEGTAGATDAPGTAADRD